MRPRTDKDKKRLKRSFVKPSGVRGFYDIYERWGRKDCYIATVAKREIPDGMEIRDINNKPVVTRGRK